MPALPVSNNQDRTGASQGAESAAQDPVHHLEQLVDLGVAAARLDLLADAAADVAVEQPQRHLVEGGLDGRDLGDDVDAVLVLVDHAGHAADLALDAAQAGLELLLVHAVAGHGASSPRMPHPGIVSDPVPGVGIRPGIAGGGVAARAPARPGSSGGCAGSTGSPRPASTWPPSGPTVVYDPAATGPPAFAGKVAALGYDPAAADPGDGLRTRLVAAAALTLPVLALAMVPALQYPGWQWLAGVLATPVVLWAGSGFHRAALAGLANRAATMDTLVSLGTLAAWGWSVAALLFAGAGDPTGMGSGAHVSFEVAAVIVVLVLFGRWLEQRARGRSGQALRRLLELGAGTAMVLRDGVEVAVPVEAVT